MSLLDVRDSGIAYAITNGIIMAQGGDTSIVAYIPFTLNATPYPRSVYQKAERLMIPFNKIIDGIARDLPFLYRALAKVTESDAFNRRLLDMAMSIYADPPMGGKHEQWKPQTWMLGIHRSDYMVAGKDIKQVEINTISSGFPAVSTRMHQLHQYLYSRWRTDLLLRESSASGTEGEHPESCERIPSISNEEIPRAMAKAVDVWAMDRGYSAVQQDEDGNVREFVIAFIVAPVESNISDQRCIEQSLWEKHKRPVVRLTLEECSGLSLNRYGDLVLPQSRGDVARKTVRYVALVYFRCSYSPNDFPNEACWKGRELLERSSAIKCPSLPYHLCTTKKIQQVMCDEKVRLRYLSPEDSSELVTCMVRQYDLTERDSKEEVREAIERAIKDPSSHVLKPQREGGGNLIYGEAMQNMLLKGITQEDAAELILMETINVTQWDNIVVRKGGELVRGKTISEMGIYGTFLGNGTWHTKKHTQEAVESSLGSGLTSEEVQLGGFNHVAGCLVRAKFPSSIDGGVMSGLACLSSAMLYEDE